jgi:hypothetical protein
MVRASSARPTIGLTGDLGLKLPLLVRPAPSTTGCGLPVAAAVLWMIVLSVMVRLFWFQTAAPAKADPVLQAVWTSRWQGGGWTVQGDSAAGVVVDAPPSPFTFPR